MHDVQIEIIDSIVSIEYNLPALIKFLNNNTTYNK